MNHDKKDEAVRVVVRDLLESLRWDDQGGYVGYAGNGKWDFASTSIEANPEQLNILFAFAGVEPDEIDTLGSCDDCVFALDGRERGYAAPCMECSRPRHSHFVQITSSRSSDLKRIEDSGLGGARKLYSLAKEWGGEGRGS